MAGAAQPVLRRVEPQPAPLMGTHPGNGLGLAIDAADESADRTRRSERMPGHPVRPRLAATRCQLPVVGRELSGCSIRGRAFGVVSRHGSIDGDRGDRSGRRGRRADDGPGAASCLAWAPVRRACRSFVRASRRCRSVQEFRYSGRPRCQGPLGAARSSIAVRICAASKSSGANGFGRRPRSRSST